MSEMHIGFTGGRGAQCAALLTGRARWAPNDESVAKFILGVAGGGNVRTKSLKSFSEDEYRKIIGSLA